MVVLTILSNNLRQKSFLLQLLDLLHLNLLVGQLLHEVRAVLEGLVVQAPREVLLELLLDVVDRLVLLVLLVLQSIIQSLLQGDEILLFYDAALPEVLLVDGLTQLAVPVEPERVQPLCWELEGCLLLLRQSIEFFEDLVDDLVTAPNIINLSFANVEVVLRFVDVLLVQVSEFELEVLRSYRQ